MNIRPIEPGDSLEELTALLHRAYADLGQMGLNYTAVDQTPATTAERTSEGQCFVAVDASGLVGTITVTPPRQDSACEHYRRGEVATFNQFAVAPERQNCGLGSQLLEHAEVWARSQGYGAVAIDTAEPARHLVSFYSRRGYIHVGWAQWEGKRYRSVIMSKEL